MARTLWLYNLYRALCTAHLHKAVFVFVFLARGLSMAEILLLQMIFTAAAFALEVPTGAWADRLGRRRSMRLGALLMAVASVGYFLAPGFAALALCELTFAAGLTLTSGADSAYLYDQLKAAGRSEEYLRRESAANAAKYVGLGVAAAAGGLLAHVRSPDATFLVTAVTCAGAFAVTYFFPATNRRASASSPGEPSRGAGLLSGMREGLSTIRRSPALCWVLAYSALLFTLVVLSGTLFQPVLGNQGFNFLGIGLVFAGLNFVGAAAALRLGRMDWSRWQEPLLWMLPALLVCCYLFMGLLGPVVVVGLMIGHYVVTGVYSPVVKTLINEEMADSAVRATVLSAESAVKRLVLLAVAPVLSLILKLSGAGDPGSAPSAAAMRPVLLVCSGIAGLAMVAQYFYQRRCRARRLAATAPGRSRTSAGDHPAAPTVAVGAVEQRS
jgi:MFS family permease